MNDLRRLAKKAKESLARDGTSWDDSVRLSSSAEEEDFAAACDPQTILALLDEVDRLTDYIDHEPSALSALRTVRLAERARIRSLVEGLPEPVYTGDTWTCDASAGWDVAIAAVIAAIVEETT